MLKSKEEKDLCSKYINDCNELWIRHHRMSCNPPSEAYDREKAELESEFKKELKRINSLSYSAENS